MKAGASHKREYAEGECEHDHVDREVHCRDGVQHYKQALEIGIDVLVAVSESGVRSL